MKHKYIIVYTYAFYLFIYFSEGGLRFKVTWIVTQLFSTFYAFLWDVSMDWSLFDLNSQNYLLRDHLIYSRNSIYYVSIVTNLILRSSWIFTVIYTESIWVVISIAFGEVTRRFIWSLFRVENEVDGRYFHFLLHINRRIKMNIHNNTN